MTDQAHVDETRLFDFYLVCVFFCLQGSVHFMFCFS